VAGACRHRTLLPVALVAVALAGCGGRHHVPPAPQLPAALARSLAVQADAVASRLDAGDECGAREHALALQQAAIAAVNERRIPAGYQEPLLGDIALLVQRITCTAEPTPASTAAPPAASPTPAGEKMHGDVWHCHGPRGDKLGKGKGRDKRKRTDDS
jgi:hypothetical protein